MSDTSFPGLGTDKKRIALIGSAPSSINLAPYDDPNWFIIGCSPGAYGPCRRADAWCELHRFEPQIPGQMGSGKPWFSPEYCEFMIRLSGTVWMSPPLPTEFRNAKPYPIEYMIERYGPYFFSSSLSYMFALALETPGVEEIGLWGVDMSAHEEYGQQRPGCQYFITLAQQRGIHVTIPPESDLLQPTMYGVTENHPMMIKLSARKRELESQKSQCDQQANIARERSLFLAGAIDDLDYIIKTWVTSQSWIIPSMRPTGNEDRQQNAEPMHTVTSIFDAAGEDVEIPALGKAKKVR